MDEKNETDKLQRLIDRCDKCDLAECINCEISWTEVQALKGLLDLYNNLKEIEEEHRKENGELRVELKKVEEKNKKLKKALCYMVNQFAYSNKRIDEGNELLTTAGLSALEEAFDALDIDEEIKRKDLWFMIQELLEE